MDETPKTLGEAEVQELRRLSEEYKHQPDAETKGTLWSLLGDLHNQKMLRWWITLESVPLQPLVTRDENGEFVLHQLLTIPESTGNVTLRTPWAYIAWAWPAQRLLRIETIKNWPGLPPVAFTRAHVLSRQQAELLEAALSKGTVCPSAPREIIEFFSKLAAYFPWAAPLNNERGEALWKKQTSPPASVCISSPRISALGARSQLALDIRQTLRESGQVQAIRTVDRLLARLDSASFSVAVVGEFRRGKSTLINKLLGQDVLPAGCTQLGALLTRVTYAPEDSLVLKRPGQSPARISLASNGWEEIARELADSKSAVAELNIRSEWLRDTGLQFFDTPGANSEQTEQLAPTMEVLATADAAIMVVNALSPLGLSEREFLAQHVAVHSVPRIAVVLTHLDQIPEHERESVVTYTAAHLHKWSSAAFLGTTLDRDKLAADTKVAFAGVAELRELLSQWIRDADHGALVVQQVIDGLRRMAEEAVAQLNARRTALSLNGEKRAELREKATAAIEKTRLDWEDVKLGFQKREIAIGDLMETRLFAQKDDLVDRLRYELRNRSEPAVWWSEDLPFRLRQEFGRLGKDAQSALEFKIADDFRWLQERAKAIYSRSLSEVSIDVAVPIEVSPGVKGKDLSDLYKLRQYTRLAVGGVAIGAFALLGPLASAVSLAGGVLSENYFRKQLDTQKQELSQHLARVIDELLHSAAQMVRGRVHVIYVDIATRLKVEGDEWIEINRRALVDPIRNEGEGETAEIDARVHRWTEILTKLKTNTHA